MSDILKYRIHVLLVVNFCTHLFGQEAGCVKNYEVEGVADRYVHVANTYCDCVTVFTTEGEYVTSFGQRGAYVGNFMDPS